MSVCKFRTDNNGGPKRTAKCQSLSGNERRTSPRLAQCQLGLRCSLHERPLFPCQDSADSCVIAAKFMLRASAAQLRHFCSGLLTLSLRGAWKAALTNVEFCPAWRLTPIYPSKPYSRSDVADGPFCWPTRCFPQRPRRPQLQRRLGKILQLQPLLQLLRCLLPDHRRSRRSI